MAIVTIRAFGSVGGDLGNVVTVWCYTWNVSSTVWGYVEDGDGPKGVLVHCLEVGKCCKDLFRASIGRDIPVLGGPVHEDVAYTPADEVRLKTRVVERGEGISDKWWNLCCIHMRINERCRYRESNPGLVLGKDAFYH